MTPTDITLSTVQAVFAYREQQRAAQYAGCREAVAAGALLRNTPDAGKFAITAAPPSPRAALLAQAAQAAKPTPKAAPISRPAPRPPQVTRPVVLGAPQMLSASETLAAAFPDASSRPSVAWLKSQAHRGAVPVQTIDGEQLFDVARVKALIGGEAAPARVDAAELTTAEHWAKYKTILEQHGRQAASGYYRSNIARS